MDLWEYFNNNEGKKITKWSHYFPVYEKHFAPLRDKPIKLLEIGVLNGGSLEMWRKYFHPDSVIVGIDINPDCKNHEQEGINIRIGDQSDPIFLKSLIDEFGAFDLVLDDGSHHVDHVNKTFQFLYPLIDKDGMYFIEDTHAAYWQSHGGGGRVAAVSPCRRLAPSAALAPAVAVCHRHCGRVLVVAQNFCNSCPLGRNSAVVDRRHGAVRTAKQGYRCE
jgi:hypothetical protein